MDWQALTQSRPALALIPAQLRPLAEYLELAPGATLFRVNERVERVYAIVAGEVRLIRRDAAGREVVLQRSRGGFFAEASLFNPTYHCDAVAAEATQILRFPLAAFRSALDADSEFRNAWMSHLTREIRKLRSQNERLSLHGAAERILHYIETEGSDGVLLLQQTRKAWAAELGLSHEALYRALRRLEDAGSLLVSDNRLEIAARG